MVALIARTGRQNQRYENGCRLIAGCIPYRFTHQKLEVLVVKAQKSDAVLFPKGGWETDETREAAALREAMEEAGVEGAIGEKLGVWTFSSKGHADADHIAYMFPLKVHKLHDSWPEMHRERIWMQAADARKRVKHQWMTEALDKLIMEMELRMKEFPSNNVLVLDMPMKQEAQSEPSLVVKRARIGCSPNKIPKNMIRPEPDENPCCALVNSNLPCNCRQMALCLGRSARAKQSLICTNRCLSIHLISSNCHQSAHPNRTLPAVIFEQTCFSN